MEILYPAFLVVWLGGGPLAVGIWALNQWRAKRRNGYGECAVCGQPWSLATQSDRYLLQGRLVCSTCAQRAKRRMAWQFVGLVAAAAYATGSVLMAGEVVLVALPVVSVFGGLAGALKMMKFANRRAQSSLTAGMQELR